MRSPEKITPNEAMKMYSTSSNNPHKYTIYSYGQVHYALNPIKKGGDQNG